ncbi:MAG: putative F420-dependent oxidoreductase [Gammaproteobacteria bacterium]|jgi:probable F420-dependent oxidoreductase
MKFGIAYPNLLDGEQIKRFAIRVEELGFESIWAGDHIVFPAAPVTGYPYTESGTFQRAADVPFIEPFTLLSYIASVTSRIRIGTTVIIVPYRHPIVQAKMFAGLDVLTGGRVICGVGVGWLKEEFDALDAPFAERGAMTNEYLEIFKCLWRDKVVSYDGNFHQFSNITFEPKPVQQPRIPIWVGGHTRHAIRRTVDHGDAWHPTRQTAEWVAERLPFLREYAQERGRNADEITISLKRALHFSDLGFSQGDSPLTTGTVIGTPGDVLDDVKRCEDIGLEQLTYDFRTNDFDECIRITEHLADKVIAKLG